MITSPQVQLPSEMRANLQRRFKWMAVLINVCAAFGVYGVSTTMPAVAQVLHGYGLYAVAFGVPVAAQLAANVLSAIICDRRGPILPFLIGLVLTAAGMAICGFATSMPLFVLGRALDGAGAGLTIVANYVMISELIPSEKQPSIFGAISMAWVLPSLIGPLLAAVITENSSWRAVYLGIFGIVVASLGFIVPTLRALPLRRGPVGALIAEGDARLTPQVGSAPDRARPMTRRERVTVGVGLVVAVLAAALQVAGSKETQLPPHVRYPLMFALIVVIVAAVPLLLPRGTLRAKPGLPAIVMTRAWLVGSFFASEMFLPYFLHSHGWSLTAAGMVLTAGSISWSIGSLTQGRLSPRLVAQAPIVGAMVLVCGIALTAGAAANWLPLLVVVAGWFIAGFGVGLSFPALAVLGLKRAEAGKSGEASGAMQVGDTLGIAVTIALTGALQAALNPPASFAVPIAACAAVAALTTLLARRTLA